MDQKVIEFNKAARTKNYPEFRAGDVVRVHRKIKEGGKERTQVFEGLIIAIKGRQSSSPKITVRKVTNGFGVELIVPIHSPIVEKIELVKRAKVRRAKLYYIREKSAKESRMKYKDLGEFLAPEEEEKKDQEAESSDQEAEGKDQETENKEQESEDSEQKKEEKEVDFGKKGKKVEKKEDVKAQKKNPDNKAKEDDKDKTEEKKQEEKK